MKTFIALLAALFCSTTYAQITLEHEIQDSNYYFTLIQPDSGEYYYMTQFYGAKDAQPQNESVDFKLYDLNYNLVKEIDIPMDLGLPTTGILTTYITRRLFDLDDSIEYLICAVAGDVQYRFVRIFKESGALLFSCDSCSLGYYTAYYSANERGIYNTPQGAKMLIMKHYYIDDPVFPGNRIYSLPGKLPSSTSSVEDDISYIQSALDIEAVPNPASDHIQINYHLPAGTFSGYIAIRDTKGAELQTHPINYTEGSISIDVRDLSPGSYYCCLLTSDGRTTVKKMMVVR